MKSKAHKPSMDEKPPVYRLNSQTLGHQAHYHHITNGSGNGNGNIQVDQFIDLGIKLNDKLSEDNWVHVVRQQVQKAPISL